MLYSNGNVAGLSSSLPKLLKVNTVHSFSVLITRHSSGNGKKYGIIFLYRVTLLPLSTSFVKFE